MMKTYLVGGAVRDMVMGNEPKDRDWVIVGATQDDVDRMIAQGFQQVGADFPVFLHPETGEEYALARVERKTGNGYGGFTVETVNVTLEEDLSRRDTTMNAMAFDPVTYQIIDPFGGQKDIGVKTIRHTSEAFAEDPLRVLRVARFIARYDFMVDFETFKLCKRLVENGELEHLSRERVWVEFEKILSERNSINAMFFLHEIGALKFMFGFGVGAAAATISERWNAFEFEFLPPICKFVILTANCAFDDAWFDRARVPNNFKRAWKSFSKYRTNLSSYNAHSAKWKIAFLKDFDFMRNSEKFVEIESAFAWQDRNFPVVKNWFMTDAEKINMIDNAKIAAQFKDGREIAEAIFSAQVAIIS